MGGAALRGAAGTWDMILCSPQWQKTRIDAGLPGRQSPISSPPEVLEPRVDVGAAGAWDMILCSPERPKPWVDVGLPAAQIH